MRQYRPETYETVRDLDQTVKIEASNNNLIELLPMPKIEVIEYKPVPQYSSDEVQARAENLDLSLRRSA